MYFNVPCYDILYVIGYKVVMGVFEDVSYEIYCNMSVKDLEVMVIYVS